MARTYDEIQVGDAAVFEKTITETDVYLYAGITGDFNPAHVNAKKAAESRFKKPIAHGMLVAGLISTVLGTRLPGEGTIYMGQELKFTAPVFFGDTITVTATVVEKLEKGRVRLETVCRNQNDEVVTTGTALVLAPRN